MFKSMTFFALGLMALAPRSALAADICETYSVVRGDTLRLIAEQYYGARELSPIIYEANIGTIGSDQNSIEIGMRLSIPCREDMLTSLEKAFAEFMVMQTALANQTQPNDLAVSEIPMTKRVK